MNVFNVLLLLGVFLSSTFGFISGYLACYVLKKEEKIIYVKRTSDVDLEARTPANAAYPSNQRVDEVPNSDAKRFSERDDVINHEGVGIVYRPTDEEITKMQEDETVRAAKEEIARSFRGVNPTA